MWRQKATAAAPWLGIGAGGPELAENRPRGGQVAWRTGLASVDAISGGILRPLPVDHHQRHAGIRSCPAPSMTARRPRRDRGPGDIHPASGALHPPLLTSRQPTAPRVCPIERACDPGIASFQPGAAAESQGRMDHPKTRLTAGRLILRYRRAAVAPEHPLVRACVRPAENAPGAGFAGRAPTDGRRSVIGRSGV
jgi:hypothetical protein